MAASADRLLKPTGSAAIAVERAILPNVHSQRWFWACGRQRTWIALGLLAATVLVALAVVVVVHHERVQAERRDPSFRHGQRVMLNTVYPSLRGGSVKDACRAAMETPASPPSNLKKQKAIDGCVYQEFLLDN
jgi:hypothetical protein